MNPLRFRSWPLQQNLVSPDGDRGLTLRCRLWLRRRYWKLAARRRALRLLQLSPFFTEVEYRCNF